MLRSQPGLEAVGLGFLIAPAMGWMCLLLWVMGLLYNVPPVRAKDQPYADVLSESVNNPIRLAMGWYSTGTAAVPPLSALLAYWMFGAFLMAMKRMAEYRRMGDPALLLRPSPGPLRERPVVDVADTAERPAQLLGLLGGRVEAVLVCPPHNPAAHS